MNYSIEERRAYYNANAASFKARLLRDAHEYIVNDYKVHEIQRRPIGHVLVKILDCSELQWSLLSKTRKHIAMQRAADELVRNYSIVLAGGDANDLRNYSLNKQEVRNDKFKR